LSRCARCGREFLYGVGHGGARQYRYCSVECAAASRDSKKRKYRLAYRRSPEGKAQHADEERRRRERRRNSVGDHSGQAVISKGNVEAMKPPPNPCAASKEEPVEWCVEVPPELASVARRLRRERKEMTCVVCGCRGYVAAVRVVRPTASKRRQGRPLGPLRKRE